MRLKLSLVIILFSFTWVDAQSQIKKSGNKPQAKNAGSIRQIDGVITVDQMCIINNSNLDDFIKDLQKTPIKLSNRLQDMPELVKGFLGNFSSDKFTIANPGADWNCCCDRDDKHANRELICQGNNDGLYVMSYLTGGIGTLQHLILIKFNSGRIIDFWAGSVQGDLKTKPGILKSLKQHNFQHLTSQDKISI